jgi:predicted amidophosphoribosyltransferase
LSRKQRLNNLKDAFRLNHDIEGKNIALIDDVVTTGSTMSELSRLLRKAGAHHVEIWCLARTPLDK